MSRCFPYPPPGYEKNDGLDSALIEPIKLSREEEKARKHEKKEKKREKKEKQKAKEGGEIESKKHDHKRRRRDERSQDPKVDNHQKRRKTEVESNDKSSITEEHGPAVGSQNSSDSSLNSSNKRVKESSSSDVRHNSGNKIRIRMPTPRHTDPEVLPIKEQPSSAIGRINDACGQGIAKTAPRSGIESGENPCSTSKNAGPRITLKLGAEKPCQTSSTSEKLPGKVEESCQTSSTLKKLPGKGDGSLTSKLCRTCPPALVLQIKNLVEEWIPPTMESDQFEDEDWFLQTTRNVKPSSKKAEHANIGFSQENSILPRACHLPEVDIYALPFTIPF